MAAWRFVSEHTTGYDDDDDDVMPEERVAVFTVPGKSGPVMILPIRPTAEIKAAIADLRHGSNGHVDHYDRRDAHVTFPDSVAEIKTKLVEWANAVQLDHTDRTMVAAIRFLTDRIERSSGVAPPESTATTTIATTAAPPPSSAQLLDRDRGHRGRLHHVEQDLRAADDWVDREGRDFEHAARRDLRRVEHEGRKLSEEAGRWIEREEHALSKTARADVAAIERDAGAVRRWAGRDLRRVEHEGRKLGEEAGRWIEREGRMLDKTTRADVAAIEDANRYEESYEGQLLEDLKAMASSSNQKSRIVVS